MKILFSRLLKSRLILLVLVFAHLLFLYSLRFTAWPEMTFWPYLILNGWLPYRDIAIAHNPLLMIDLTFFYWIFGVGLVQLKFYTWLLIITIDLALYFVVRGLFGKREALVAVALYVPLQIFYQGNGMWFDLYLTLPIILTYYLLKNSEYALGGALFALTFLSKQTALFFIPAVLFITFKGVSFKGMRGEVWKLGRIALGFAAVVVLFLGLVASLGILGDYYFWAYKFGSIMLPTSAGQIKMPSVLELAKALVVFAPLTLLVFKKFRTKATLELGLFSFFGVLGAFPRWELFHFQPALPFLTIFLAISAFKFAKSTVSGKLIYAIPLILFLALFARFFGRNLGQVERFYDAETVAVAQEINSLVRAGDEIYVLNSWDNIYPLSNTIPATKPWYPHLEWYMELPEVQDRVVGNLASKTPEYIVVGGFAGEGLSSYRPDLILNYIDENYAEQKSVGNYNILRRK